MLGRAAKEYEPPPPKSDLARTLFPSSSPVYNAKFQGKLQPTIQSIGGLSNSSSQPSPSKSLNSTARLLEKKYLSPSKKNPSNSLPANTSQRLSTVLSKQSSFQDTQVNVSKSTSQCDLLEFNEDDFDDDADLDLDMDYDLPKIKTDPVKPQNNINRAYTSQGKVGLSSSQNLPALSSSAVTWPSSPPLQQTRNMMTAAVSPRKRDSDKISGEKISTRIRPEKRRTLPWLQGTAENYHTSPQIKKCLNYQATGHTIDNCPTPRVPEKDSETKKIEQKLKTKTPWNKSGADFKNDKKKLKEKMKSSIEGHGITEPTDKPSDTKQAVTPISLSEEQKKVLDLVVNQSKSVFFTGSAGTGKSVLMRAIISELRKKYNRETDRVAITASTGLAACNIGGVTLHSFGGIGLGKDDVPALVRKIKRNPKAKQRWIRTKVLIIDEVSMVDGDLYDKLEGVARSIRNNGRPFGGIQLVITGDFFQLPPVPEYDNKSRSIKFAFDAGTWSTTIHHTIGLTQVFRQKDPVFANMLNEMRLGKITQKTISVFRSLARNVSDSKFEPTELFPTRSEVDNANAHRMSNLSGDVHKYEALDSGTVDLRTRERLLSNLMAPKVLVFKKGAQVMLIKNMDEGLVNGTLGKIQNFMSEKTFKFLVNHPVSQKALEYDSDDEPHANSHTSKATSSTKETEERLYPYVSFKLADGTRRMMLILPEEWKIELPNGEVQALRIQVPLILAWALSIHKAQGQTLQRVKIDLKRIFEKGQAYVALSRATSQAGLQVLNFEKSKVMAHPRVAQFYNSLYSINHALEPPQKAAKPLVKIPPQQKMPDEDYWDITMDDEWEGTEQLRDASYLD